jgi:hypothetical protein
MKSEIKITGLIKSSGQLIVIKKRVKRGGRGSSGGKHVRLQNLMQMPKKVYKIVQILSAGAHIGINARIKLQGCQAPTFEGLTLAEFRKKFSLSFIETRDQCYKTFYFRNLVMLIKT